MRNLLLLSGLLALALSGCDSRGAAPPAAEPTAEAAALAVDSLFDPMWAARGLWDDGNAEVAHYDATRTIYSKERRFDYVYIVVKEVFNPELIKTDDYEREGLFDVIKLNKFADIPTENYPYHFLTSAFVRRETPTQTVKLTNSSQEWCGHTFKAFELRDGTYRMDYNSYFDGEGTGTATIETPALFEDQLSYTLRSLRFADGLAFEAPVVASQVSSHAGDPKVYEAAQFEVAPDALAVRDGEAPRDCWRVDMRLDSQQTVTYWFGQQYPNLLLRMKATDGRSLMLREVSRYPYWERKPPTDAAPPAN